MMKSTALDPKHKQWLQVNPEVARKQRAELHNLAQQYQQAGQPDEAIIHAEKALETAHAVIVALRSPQTSAQTISEDFIAYAALTIYLASRYAEADRRLAAEALYEQNQQQLLALTPLYASEPELATLIHSVVQGLAKQPPANTVTVPGAAGLH